MNISCEYIASITREQFLFYEMRTTARLILEGLDDNEIIDKITKNNLYQYPTEKSLKTIARGCLKRLHYLENENIIKIIAQASSEVSKQACLYAFMHQQKLVWEFMITVIGEKYSNMDYNFSKADVNLFFSRLQEQSDVVRSWSDSTISKLKQVLVKLLVENEYIDNNKSTILNKVLLDKNLREEIINNKEEMALIAFNCFE